MSTTTQIPGFEIFDFTAEGTTKTVYWRGKITNPPIVLMHELPGMIPECIELAEKLAMAGYCVFMPLLFGRPNAKTVDFPGYLARACIRNEFYLLAKHKASPITNWLRALCREAKTRCNNQPCGVIGMCLTGGFGLVLAADDAVLAPVLSQPSLPFGISYRLKRSLGMNEVEISRVKKRTEQDGLRIMAMRFTGDVMCPPERFDEMERLFGDKFLRVDIDSSIGNPHGNPPWSHSVLTVHHNSSPGHPTRQAYDQMLTFFAEQLRN